MIEIRDRQIVIDGVSQLIISGEIHYFRLQPEQWEDRILKLKAAGGNAVASYIPWLCHELPDGDIDLDGHTRPALDLGAFIDLCHRHGLWFIARPGPFVMAEMKNEGVPYRLYQQHPEIVPVTWEGRPAPTRTLDYTAPAFLEECRRWYSQVIPIIASRQIQHGGNVIAVQLDNEVGMLSWVSNSPDLTEHVVTGFRDWLVERQGRDQVAAAYGVESDDLAVFAQVVRAPEAAISGRLMRDLGWFMRVRFARYIDALRGFAEEFGISGLPYLVNIHGTEAGGGASFPIGISQLYPSYTQADGYLAGSDHYLGDLDGGNAADLYLMNAFMAAVNRPEQPLASFEFEAGSGDYSQGMGRRNDPSAADFKLRMSVAQGNRLINYYLFTGGINYRMDITTGDGNDRISFTGEQHGTGAPIDPEGRESYTLPRLARTNQMLATLEAKLSVAEEEHDNLVMGFIPDAYMTESAYPGNPVMGEIAFAQRRGRFGGPSTVMARALLHLGFRYTAVDLQANPVPADRVLALGSTLYMDAATQESLAEWLRAGGRALIHGELPRFDLAGVPCTILIDALRLEYRDMLWGSHRYFPSIEAAGWAAPRSELRVGWAQAFAPKSDRTLFTIHGMGAACGFDLDVGRGRAIVLTAEVPADLDLFSRALAELGAVPGLRHDHPLHGLFTTSTRTPDGERFLHAINLDGVDKVLQFEDAGSPLFDGRPVTVRRRDAVMLPLGVDLGDVHVVWSTAELSRHDTSGIRLRLTGVEDAILLRTGRGITNGDAYRVEPHPDGHLVTSLVPGSGDEFIDIRWE